MTTFLGILLAGATALAGGCASGHLPVIKNAAEFQKIISDANQPVMVEFSKDQCPTCMTLESELVTISKEYQGRVLFYKFMLLNRFFQPYSPEIRDAYDLHWVPMALLFVNGEEKHRWNNDYLPDDYRQALTELVGPPSKPGQTKSQ